MTGNLPEIGNDGSMTFPTMLVDKVDVYLQNLAFTTNELIKERPEEWPKKLLVIGTSNQRDLRCRVLGREDPHYSHELIRDIEDNPSLADDYNMDLTVYSYKNVKVFYLQDKDAVESEGIYLCQPLEQQSFVLGRKDENDG
jgi:hypothetical protein